MSYKERQVREPVTSRPMWCFVLSSPTKVMPTVRKVVDDNSFDSALAELSKVLRMRRTRELKLSISLVGAVNGAETNSDPLSVRAPSAGGRSSVRGAGRGWRQ